MPEHGDLKMNNREETLDTSETHKTDTEETSATACSSYETVVLTDEEWANCPENPWVWSSWRKWRMTSAVGLYGFLASVQFVIYRYFLLTGSCGFTDL
jgi:hypothetical protein